MNIEDIKKKGFDGMLDFITWLSKHYPSFLDLYLWQYEKHLHENQQKSQSTGNPGKSSKRDKDEKDKDL